MKSNRVYQISLSIFALLFCALLTLGVFAVEGKEKQTGAGKNTASGTSFTLSTAVKPEKSGSVQVTVDGDEKKDSTGLSVKQGAAVTLKAVVAEGYAFDHWEANTIPGVTEDMMLREELRFSMPSEDLSLEAVFREHKTKYTVRIASNEFGMGNFGHKDFTPGEVVHVDASAYDGFRFVRWIDDDGALSSAGLPQDWEKQSAFSFTMPERDVNLSLEFDYVTYYFTLKINGEGEVEVGGKEKNSAGKYECTIGEEILLSAVAGTDFVFVNWAGTNSAELSDFDKTDTTLICPASDFTITVNFASSIRILTMATTDGGSIDPQPGEREVGVANIISVSATPAEGYAFSHWECSSEKGVFEDPKDSETDFTMPDEDCTVTAIFVKGGYRLTVSATAGGNVKGEEGVYEMGDKVPIEATALEGYVFSHWQSSVSGAIDSPKSQTTKVEIPGEDVKVTAVFVLKASLVPQATRDVEDEGSSFPWVAMIVILLLSAVAITLVILRERFNLSYRYLIKKWFTKEK